MLKTVVLLFSMALSIVCGAPRHKNNNRAVVVQEIIKTLVNIEAHIKTKAACEKPMVMDIFSNTEDLIASDAFCKAAKTLEKITPCNAMRRNIGHLKENLLKVGNKDCTMDHSKTDLNEFIKQLLKFSRQHYYLKH